MLTIVTLARGSNAPSNGVATWVGPEVQWVLKTNVPYKHYIGQIYDAFSHPGWVALVDDDDMLLDLSPVLRAIKKYPDAGLVYTRDIGRTVATTRGELPGAVHHLAAVRTDALNRGLMLKYPYCADAVAKLSAGMSAGAVFVDKVCYHWNRYGGQLHRDAEHRPKMLKALQESHAELKTTYAAVLAEPIIKET